MEHYLSDTDNGVVWGVRISAHRSDSNFDAICASRPYLGLGRSAENDVECQRAFQTIAR